MSLRLRFATSADVFLILTFIRGLAAYEKLLDEVEAECVLAFEDDAPAGFAFFFTSYSTFLARPGLYLEDLFVQPEFRGRGIGKALLVHLARLANARGYGRMEWSVLDWNEPAIAFYEAFGARRLPQWQICRLTGEALANYT